MDGKEELSMRRTELLQEVRKMRFEEAYEEWQRGRLTQGDKKRGQATLLPPRALSSGNCDHPTDRAGAGYQP
jgi:hypothetical protein